MAWLGYFVNDCSDVKTCTNGSIAEEFVGPLPAKPRSTFFHMFASVCFKSKCYKKHLAAEYTSPTQATMQKTCICCWGVKLNGSGAAITCKISSTLTRNFKLASNATLENRF